MRPYPGSPRSPGKAGYYRQPDLGNYWLRARVYEDGSGRFPSRDPAQEEMDLCRYVRNRPLVLVDSAGLQGCRTPDQPCWTGARPPEYGGPASPLHLAVRGIRELRRSFSNILAEPEPVMPPPGLLPW